ncbi:glycosyltransferase family 4 protein [Novosphingobium sp. PY1]|uniref:glycosyltransferase family 4 protein n=1 Tax=Novosphingobium sp. PY1 TaxID=1882221 RepID=UPI001A90AD0E|nr:glycosyltransferase family 4 protein [Novosphingobium sp. PY1]GFM28580.1 putative glycosyltransferase [Novosphingobium sp. PY1]
MKILFLAPHPFFVERGTPIAVRQAVTVLCEQGHEVDLLTYHEGAEIEIPGARILRIRPGFGISNVPIGFSAKKLVCDAWLAAAALRQVRQCDYDVVHAVEEAVFIALACRAAGKFKVVYDMDSLMPDQIAEKWPAARVLLPPLQWFERQAIRRADLVLPVCQAIADRAAKATAPAKVHLLPDVAFAPDAPDGCEVEDLRALFDSPAPLALYVGNLERYQGIDLLLEAFRQLRPEEACNLAVIGGTPEMVSSYRAKTEGLKVAERVRFLGQRNLDALGTYLAQADILCSPRLKGVNTPMKVYGYMASGRAILATDILSHSQVLDAGCAVLARPDPQAISDGMRVLIRDVDLRARLGANAATRARDLYGPAAFSRRLERAYATISPASARSDRTSASLG